MNFVETSFVPPGGRRVGPFVGEGRAIGAEISAFHEGARKRARRARGGYRVIEQTSLCDQRERESSPNGRERSGGG